jgi:hypothetical protein
MIDIMVYSTDAFLTDNRTPARATLTRPDRPSGNLEGNSQDNLPMRI